MGVVNKTIIPLALGGYEMIIATSVIHNSVAISTISYPMRTRGVIIIIVNFEKLNQFG